MNRPRSRTMTIAAAAVAVALGAGLWAERSRRPARAVAVPAPGAGRRFLTPEEFARLPRTGSIDPSRLRFSQDSIRRTFKEGGEVARLTADLKAGRVDPASIPPVRIVQWEGKVFSLDNRRLKSYQEAGLPIPFRKLDRLPEDERFKFTTRDEGIDIEIRSPR